MQAKVLLVEDSTSLAILYKEYVKDEPYDMFHVETGKEAMTFIERHMPQLVILDLKLPDMSGEDILDWINEKQFPTSVVIATAHGSVNIAVNLLTKGAEDFLEKPITAERLKASVSLHLKKAKLETLVDDLEQKFDRHNFHGFIGSSLPMQAVYKIVESAAPTTASVFICGESGTGKEVCAEALHRESNRKDKPFVAINCGAIPKDLMESEIFGHVKGAFTGATTDRLGAARQAHGGTLFLDELCEMELEMQKKLLRFLQTGTLTPLGSSKEVKVDVRIICATNRNPLDEVEQGRFREDLYYRVHVIPVDMPPLRDRGKDILELSRHFLQMYAKQDGKKFTGFKREVESVLKRYNWPGNVRQLQNIIRNIVVLNDGKQVELNQLPAPLNQPAALKAAAAEPEPTPIAMPASTPEIQTPSLEASEVEVSAPEKPSSDISAGDIKPMWMVERETIQRAIEFCDGNVLNAAVLLDLSPSTVYRKKQAWESENDTQQA
ncbi:sigma-54 dependent transcriptional regulator [Vibrio sp. SCSIO 43136]|uniref:sigma-54-dependent transcriptional regulator n=1 Tax=Vibrio sp. SCSIO 43136 TaxID=2819101 RepID=UPI002075A8FD|nr:sigma-54 dependent transcriptional regulator [Vibrio sp. SCSIO 43136]USD67798.1 sigma-54-dependent Fis family transcriptional regulator [Vibrio sp. SCSIO 43136]